MRRGASVMPGLEGSISHDTSPPTTRALMSDGDHAVPEQVKRFIFRSRKTQGDEREESLEILIPEVSDDGDDPACLPYFRRATSVTCPLVRSLLPRKKNQLSRRLRQLIAKFSLSPPSPRAILLFFFQRPICRILRRHEHRNEHHNIVPAYQLELNR